MLWILFFIVKYGIVRILCTIHILEVRASSSSPRLLCAKFCFFRGLSCWASPWRKLCTQSLTQSTSLFDVPGTEACALENGIEVKSWSTRGNQTASKLFFHELDSTAYYRTVMISTFFQTFSLAFQLPVANFSCLFCLQKIVICLLQHENVDNYAILPIQLQQQK